MNKAVVLLSGGVDSSTTLAMAKAEGYDICALSFDYHQRHRRELESAKRVASSLGVGTHLVIAFDLRAIGGSALTSDREVPKRAMSYQPSAMSEEGLLTAGRRALSAIPVTYVPARNTIFLSFALAWAEVLGAGDIFIGANAVDYSGYPDCRPEYLKAFEDMANLATKVSVEGKLRFRINAPLLLMTKADIIRKGTGLGLDYGLTWSCYDPQPAEAVSSQQSAAGKDGRPTADRYPLTGGPSSLVPCGRCDSCVFRAKGFREAGIRDPLAQL